MTISLPTRVRVAFFAVLLLGVALSWYVYLNGRSVLDVSEPLLHQQLPLLKLISRLQLEVAEQEPILYEYYATTDRAVFQRRFDSNDAAIRRSLDTLAETLDDGALVDRLRVQYARIQQLATDLDATLRVYGDQAVDWDRARELLVDVSAVGRSINGDLAEMATSIRDAVSRGGERTRSRVDSVITAVVAFCVLIVVVAGFVGYYVTAYLRETAERYKLAMFVEKNPNPVLRLSRDGKVLYSNPGVAQMLERMGRADAPEHSLLPPDIRERLSGVLQDGRAGDRFDYEIAGRVVDCVIRYLPGHDIFHCYLSDITERKQAEAQLRYQAFHDVVTGLPNRRFLQETIAGLAPAHPAAVALINVDRFRQLLSHIGPEVGDELLRAVATRLSDVCPAGASPPWLYRLEADTFVLLDPRAETNAVAAQILSALERPFHLEGREVFVSASLGFSLFPRDGKDADSLVRNAGAALHAVKQAGGGGFRIYSADMTASAGERLAMENDLRRALERAELALHFQPQVELRGGMVIGGEALLRWTRASVGSVARTAFIPIAEETGLIVPIGEWVLRHACKQALAWRARVRGDFSVAVNISARQFQQPGLVELVRDVLGETELPPSALELEITESSAMHDLAHTGRTLRELKALGVTLAIDDFGTGFSSLSYLSRFPIDRLKIDRSFVSGLGKDAGADAITAAVVTLGHSLGLRVIAEGVETREQLSALRELGCDEIQGYLFSTPLPADAFQALLCEGRQLAPERGEQGPFYEKPGLSQVV